MQYSAATQTKMQNPRYYNMYRLKEYAYLTTKPMTVSHSLNNTVRKCVAEVNQYLCAKEKVFCETIEKCNNKLRLRKRNPEE